VSRSKRTAGRQQNRPAVVSNPQQAPEHHLTVTRSRMEIREGPLPESEELARYEAVVEGAANRIIVMAEKQSDHRRAIEAKVIGGDNIRAYLGMTFGACLQGGVLVVTYLLGRDGHEAAAVATALGGSVTGLSTIWANWRRSQERAGRQ
jgi:uncharacterized membrane protein